MKRYTVIGRISVTINTKNEDEDEKLTRIEMKEKNKCYQDTLQFKGNANNKPFLFANGICLKEFMLVERERVKERR